MENNEKVQIIEAIAQYNTLWSQAIYNGFGLYSQFWWKIKEDEFYNKIVWVNNSNLQKIDSIDYMYNTTTEEWASEEEMIEEYNRIF